jgi:hypothetical protein
MARVLSMPPRRDDDRARPRHTLPPIPSPLPCHHRLTPTEEARLLAKFHHLAACIGRPIIWQIEYLFDHYLGTTPPGITTIEDYIALREREHDAQI